MKSVRKYQFWCTYRCSCECGHCEVYTSQTHTCAFETFTKSIRHREYLSRRNVLHSFFSLFTRREMTNTMCACNREHNDLSSLQYNQCVFVFYSRNSTNVKTRHSLFEVQDRHALPTTWHQNGPYRICAMCLVSAATHPTFRCIGSPTTIIGHRFAATTITDITITSSSNNSNWLMHTPLV